MTEVLLVSHALLWCLVIVLALVVLALARQVGVLSERVAPAGALMPTTGPRVGEHTEPEPVVDIEGSALTVGGPGPSPLLILWISPACPVCRALVPAAIAMARSDRLRLVFASDGGTLDAHRAYVRELRLEPYPYVISPALGLQYVVSKLPFAVLIGADGILKSKGLVNTREHLESLVESMLSGIRSLQEFVGAADGHEGASLGRRAL